MNFLKIAIIVVAFALFAFFAIYAYYGGFSKIRCKIIETGGETLVYKECKGDYKQVSKEMNTVYYSLLNDYKLETTKGFGIYFDNPKKINKNELRSEMGCIVEKGDTARLSSLGAELMVKTLPVEKYLVVEFPYKGMMSVLVGIMKVYPAINKYLKDKGYGEDGFVMEIYDIPNKKVEYRKELK